MTLILSNDDVERLLPMSVCVAAPEDLYRELGERTAVYRRRSDTIVAGPDPGAAYLPMLRRTASWTKLSSISRDRS